MSYLAQETSIEGGQPIELFHISNAEDSYTYTSAQQPIVFSGNTYQPRPLICSEDKIESLNARREITLKLPATDPVVQRYIPGVPASEHLLRMYRLHSTDGTVEVVQVFQGAVSNVAITKNNEAVILARSSASLLDRTVPKQTCRGNCNFVLYGPRCKVDNTDYTVTAEVIDISPNGLLVTVAAGSDTFPATGLQLSAQLTADAFFMLGGTTERGGGLERRMIRSSANLGGNSARFGLLLPFIGLQQGMVVDLLAGCDLAFTTCRDKFDNTINFGGFPRVPKKNPFEVGVDK